ncbi:MAG: hypothetical protein Q9185_002412 [Variospora sp. 1 TL-2023]
MSVEWTVQTYKVGEEEVRLFTSMKRLQRCKLIVETSKIHFSTWALRELRDQDWHSKVPRMHCGSLYHINVSPCWALKVEDTVLGLVYQLNYMPQLKELHLEYKEDDNLRLESFFVHSADGSLRRYSGYNIKMLFNSDLRYMKKVHIRGNLDDFWTASIASAVILPKEIVSRVKWRIRINVIRDAPPRYDSIRSKTRSKI